MKKKEKELRIRKHRFCEGLFIGLTVGCFIGYLAFKYFSKDKQKRLEEKKFYRDRLSEIKSALYQIKARFNLNEDALEAVDEVDDLITQEIVL